MKKTALTLTILCTSCAFIFAGPESLPSGKEMKEMVQPMAPACPSWCGFYIGGFGGYKFADTDITLDLSGIWDDPPFPDERDVVENIGSRDLDTSGAEAGGLIGYNFCINHWMLGVEAAGGYLWLRDSDVTEHFFVPASQAEDHLSTSFKTHYLFTAGPRFGYTFCRWMPYVTGGVAVGDVEFDQNIVGHFIPGTFHESVDHQNDTRVGFMVGGGVEFAMSNHWRIRGQYQYIDLGCEDYTSHGGPVPTDFDFTGNHEICLREHNASIALIFGF